MLLRWIVKTSQQYRMSGSRGRASECCFARAAVQTLDAKKPPEGGSGESQSTISPG
jgi:hypothetical protein